MNTPLLVPHEGELKPDLYIETKEKLLAHDLKEINQKLFKILDHLSAPVETGFKPVSL